MEGNLFDKEINLANIELDKILNTNAQDNINIDDFYKKIRLEDREQELNRHKDLLQKLFKETFESRLLECEKNSRSHFSMITLSMELTKYVTNLSVKIQRQVQEKINKDKEKKMQKGRKISKKKGNSPYKGGSSTKMNFYSRQKTPFRANNKKKDNISISEIKRHFEKNKSSISLIKTYHNGFYTGRDIQSGKMRSKSIHSKAAKSTKTLNKTLVKKKNNLNVTNLTINTGIDSFIEDSLHRPSVVSIKSIVNSTKSGAKIDNCSVASNTPFKANKTRNNVLIGKLGQNSYTGKRENKPNESKEGLTLRKKFNKFLKADKDSRKSIISLTNPNVPTSNPKGQRKKTPFKKKNSKNTMTIPTSLNASKSKKFKKVKSEKINNLKNNNNNNKSFIVDDVNNIISMESNLQKDDLIFNNNDPLLISCTETGDMDIMSFNSPLRKKTKSDYPISNSKLNSIKSNLIKITTTPKPFNFNIEKDIEDYQIQSIIQFLPLKDILSLKFVSKKINKIILDYYLKKLEEDKKYFIDKQKELKIDKKPEKLSIEQLKFSSGTEKAIQLLNEDSINKLFCNDEEPHKDILFAYTVFFQIINSPLVQIAYESKTEFWKNCRNYFSKGKTFKVSDIIKSTIKEKKIDLQGNNLYKLYWLTNNNLNKITPAYYSKICGNTGLFMFFIKDILDFVGFSSHKQNRKNIYWTFSYIIDSLNKNIEKIESFKKQ